MIILQYAAFLLPTCKDQWTGIHEQSGARITCKKFVKIGSGYYWTPYIIMIAAVICIPVFL